MSTYAIGDVQGCYQELMDLLELIKFDKQKDQLWFTGDLVNRGSGSLKVLRFIKALGDSAVTVLGNHDLHFLSVMNNIVAAKNKDTFHDVLDAKDARELTDWLRCQPLIYHDKTLNYTMTHAGIPPLWNLKQALQYGEEVHQLLRSNNYTHFLENMYGDEPDQWDEALTGWPRLRLITNYFTRMRYCDGNGRLELRYKGPVGQQPTGYYPWFAVPGYVSPLNIIFGHWASLRGKVSIPNIHALDTGCCWGNELTAMRLEDQHRFNVSCHP